MKKQETTTPPIKAGDTLIFVDDNGHAVISAEVKEPKTRYHA